MPIESKDIPGRAHMSLLVIGPGRIGKTQLISTAIGKSYVFCSDEESKLDSAVRNKAVFAYDRVDSTDGSKLLNQFEAAIKEARRGIEADEYQTVVWDTLSMFCTLLVHAELKATENAEGDPDGRRAYSNSNRRIWSCVNRFLQLQAHRVVLSHEYEAATKMDGQLVKRGEGILPNVDGSVRNKIPAMFVDVVYMAKEAGSEERRLHCSMRGVYGPGSNTYPGFEKVPADLSLFWKNRPGLKALAPTNVKASTPISQPKPSPAKPATKPTMVKP
jgi:hypothetical protein